MKRIAIVAAATLAMALSACETATPYQPIATANAVSGGFTDQQLDDSHFRVTFSGGYVTMPGREFRPEEWQIKADLALFEAKSRMKGSCSISEPLTRGVAIPFFLS